MFKIPKNIARSLLLSLTIFSSNAEATLKIKDNIVEKIYDKSGDKDMIFEFPKLKGSYGVGFTKRHIFDQNRKETHNQIAQRELMIYIWYPSDIDKNSLVPYQKEDAEASKFALKQQGYPENDLNDIDKVYSHAVVDAPISHKNSPFPIVIFSHGYLGCIPAMYTSFYEELASHGYIIVSIAHTDFAVSVKFPDGRQITPTSEKYIEAQSKMPGCVELDIWFADVQFVLDQLTKFNTNYSDIFFKFLDTKRVGMFGHSFGGATAFQLCLKDPRFKAGISLDGALFAEDTKITDLTKPFLFILAQETIDNFNRPVEELAKKHSCSVDLVQKGMKELGKIYPKSISKTILPNIIIPNIGHMGFSDLLLMKELPLYKNNKQIMDLEKAVGLADGYKTIELINENIVQFFNNYLKNVETI